MISQVIIYLLMLHDKACMVGMFQDNTQGNCLLIITSVMLINTDWLEILGRSKNIMVETL